MKIIYHLIQLAMTNLGMQPVIPTLKMLVLLRPIVQPHAQILTANIIVKTGPTVLHARAGAAAFQMHCASGKVGRLALPGKPSAPSSAPSSSSIKFDGFRLRERRLASGSTLSTLTLTLCLGLNIEVRSFTKSSAHSLMCASPTRALLVMSTNTPYFSTLKRQGMSC